MKQVGMIYLVLFMFFSIGSVETWASQPSDAASEPKAREAEIEKYVMARIDLAESMKEFFQKRGGAPRFGGPEGPSMEEMKKLEQEINAYVANVLARHDLTIEEYQKRSPEVFADKEGVNHFLEAHPDLKKRYEALPPSPSRRR